MFESKIKSFGLVGLLLMLAMACSLVSWGQPGDNLVDLPFSLGSVITNPDGSKGVVFYINPTCTGGCMVALEDASSSCKWGSSGDIPFLRNYTYTLNECLLSDLDGYANTEVLREYQSFNTSYVSGLVDFEHGWYVPSAGQLRKIYAALPFIEDAITTEGGATLADNAYYWSSSENSESYAWTSAFEMSSKSKTTNLRVRAVRDFSINNTLRIQVGINDSELGNATGSGFYAIGSQVTVTAAPENGNLFRGWTEAGHLVSQDPTYTFTVTSNRELVANFAIRGGIGTLVTNPDGSQGILFHLNEDGSQGLMVALEDASEGCQWGTSSDIVVLRDQALNTQRILHDQSGYHNTQLLRLSQGTNNGYAASVVDFENGWYLPSAGQLRKLYAALPLLEEAIIRAGGSSLADGKYWSSTEYSASYASTPGFELGSTLKTMSCRVRAIRNYIPYGDHVVLLAANDESYGSVSGAGTFEINQIVTVTAVPNMGYQFDHWSEDGAIVSYEAEYQFPLTRSLSLVAHFVVPGSVGSVVNNTDGSRGVVFYTDPSGSGSLMVALEDVSTGSLWGTNQDITALENINPSQLQNLLEDQNGYSNTQIIRDYQGNNDNYAAGIVDYSNGWYLPSAGEMRKLYAALPLIEEVIVTSGGSLMIEDSYWSSTEQSASYAWTPSFGMSSSGKMSSHRVRAIRGQSNSAVHTQTINLENGWVWISAYLECDENTLTSLKDQISSSSVSSAIIKSQNKYVQYINGQWFGNLTTLGNESMYMIALNQNLDVTFTGSLAHPENHPITLDLGWNWIGFLSPTSLPIVEALGNFTPNVGDVIKSQNGFATYIGTAWAGSLKNLVPGKGYMYQNNGAAPLIFVYPLGSKNAQSQRQP